MARPHSTTTPPSPPLPSLTWDSHMHIVSPDTTTYPLSPTTTYTPAPHTLADMTTFYRSLLTSTPNTNNQTISPVFIQPSPYGTDNTLLLSALSTLGPSSSRGIVVIDPSSPPPLPTLQKWHALGVRGVRINLVSVGRILSPDELKTELMRYAQIIHQEGLEGWVLQLYISLASIPALEAIVPHLPQGIRVVVDHLGSPTLPEATTTATAAPAAVDPTTLPGFPSLLNLLEAGRTYVKISAPYRMTRNSTDINEPSDVDEVVKALLKVRGGERVVWASDWPHTRFERKGVDVGRWVGRCWGLVREVVREEGGSGTREDEEVQRRGEMLFGGNARELWGC